MIETTVQLSTFMDTARAARRVDLYTITLATGTVLRWTAGDRPVTLPDGRRFACGPLFTRSRLSLVAGVEVDEMSIDITPRPADLVDGVPLMRLARVGGLRGCQVLLEWAYFSVAGEFQGLMPKFAGAASPLGYDVAIRLKARSEFERLLSQVPPDVYQASCLNALYDARCGKSRAALQVVGAAGAVTSQSAFGSALGQAGGYFAQGVLRFTAGANSGVARTVRSFQGGAFTFALPFPFAIASGDPFIVYPGCDGSQVTCQAKFGNLARFRGQPYIPSPEVAT